MCPARVEIGDEAIYQALHDEVVLLNLKSQQYFGLNDVGSEMWRLLIQYGDVETVAHKICEDYDADPEVVRKDLELLIERLMAASLLKPAGGAAHNRDL